MQSIIQRYEQELIDSLIPFWESYCVDREHGGFLICLDRNGDPYDTTKHLWMHWRTVYMFAARAAGLYRAGGGTLSRDHREPFHRFTLMSTADRRSLPGPR